MPYLVEALGVAMRAINDLRLGTMTSSLKNLPGSAPGISMRRISKLTVAGFTCTGPLTAEAVPTNFIFPRAVTAKRPIAFWVRY